MSFFCLASNKKNPKHYVYEFFLGADDGSFATAACGRLREQKELPYGQNFVRKKATKFWAPSAVCFSSSPILKKNPKHYVYEFFLGADDGT